MQDCTKHDFPLCNFAFCAIVCAILIAQLFGRFSHLEAEPPPSLAVSAIVQDLSKGEGRERVHSIGHQDRFENALKLSHWLEYAPLNNNQVGPFVSYFFGEDIHMRQRR